MRRLWQFILLMGGLAGSVSATSVLTCNFNGANGGALQSNNCYGGSSTPLTFSTIETVDWSTAFGNAAVATHNTGTSGAWTTTTGTENLGVDLSYYQGVT